MDLAFFLGSDQFDQFGLGFESGKLVGPLLKLIVLVLCLYAGHLLLIVPFLRIKVFPIELDVKEVLLCLVLVHV